jgi:hypothetical protein
VSARATAWFGTAFTDCCADNPVAQKLLVKQLQRFDLNVIATSNGEEAVAGKLLLLNGPHQSHYIIFRMGAARSWIFQPRNVRPPYVSSHAISLSIGLTPHIRYASL